MTVADRLLAALDALGGRRTVVIGDIAADEFLYGRVARVSREAPVLILQGDNDLQVSVQDARLLAAARPGARLVIVPGMNHVLKDAPTDRAGNIATYADPNRPLAPELAAAIVAFVKSAGR